MSQYMFQVAISPKNGISQRLESGTVVDTRRRGGTGAMGLPRSRKVVFKPSKNMVLMSNYKIIVSGAMNALHYFFTAICQSHFSATEWIYSPLPWQISGSDPDQKSKFLDRFFERKTIRESTLYIGKHQRYQFFNFD